MAKHRIPVPPGTTAPEPVSAVLSWRVRTGREREFEYWFNLPGLPVQVPPRWKTVLIAFTGVYPVVLLFTWLVTPHLATQPLWLRAAWLPLLLAPTLTYVLMPALTRLFRPWLRPRHP